MPIFKTYSRRLQEAENPGPDVYQYDEISSVLRGQVCCILDDVLHPWDNWDRSADSEIWRAIE